MQGKANARLIFLDIISADIPSGAEFTTPRKKKKNGCMLIFPGTKADLWNTVSPKMAQRVFSEMLNESLSIIATRFIHVRPRDIPRD